MIYFSQDKGRAGRQKGKKMYSIRFTVGENPNPRYYKYGLYLIGQIHWSEDLEELLYWIKVGRANNLERRMKEYLTHVPMLIRMAYRNVSPDDVKEAEKACHEQLAEVCRFMTAEADEWFCVDKETFDKIRKRGFKYFRYFR